MNPPTVKLSANEKAIFLDFITMFLPKRGNKRKNNANEIEYLADSLDRIFRSYFGFRLNRETVLGAFEELGYDIFYKKGEFDGKDFKPSLSGSAISGRDVYLTNDAMYIYVDVTALRVTELRLTTFPYQENTDKAKIKLLDYVKSEIELFRKSKMR